MGKYDDILNQRRPASRRPKMSALERAAQFSPFAAVKGLSEEIEKRERLFESRALLSPDRFSELDFTLKGLCPGDKIKITFYSDGLYNEREEIFADADFQRRTLKTKEREISFDDIKNIIKEGYDEF